MSATPTTTHWARGCARYISDAYGFDDGERSALAEAFAELIDEFELLGDLTGRSVPVSVADERAGRPSWGANPELRIPPRRDLRIPVSTWADFVCQYLGVGRAVQPERRVELWERAGALLADYELDDRPVVFLSETLQGALSSGPSQPA